MATDKSEPRIGVIMKVAVLSIVTLIAVRIGLFAYFDDIARAEEQRKFGEAKPEALLNLREDEKARLSSGAMSIQNAMQQIAARGRNAASPDIMPSASRDVAPLQGWSKMQGEVPPSMMVDAAAPPQTSVDAGVPAQADGAAPKTPKPNRARTDAGPTKPTPKTP